MKQIKQIYDILRSLVTSRRKKGMHNQLHHLVAVQETLGTTKAGSVEPKAVFYTQAELEKFRSTLEATTAKEYDKKISQLSNMFTGSIPDPAQEVSRLKDFFVTFFGIHPDNVYFGELSFLADGQEAITPNFSDNNYPKSIMSNPQIIELVKQLKEHPEGGLFTANNINLPEANSVILASIPVTERARTEKRTIMGYLIGILKTGEFGELQILTLDYAAKVLQQYFQFKQITERPQR